jgi:hypothetical protein
MVAPEQQQQKQSKQRAPALCDVEGCMATRKDRFVRDWERRACGMEHLHPLEEQLGAVAVWVLELGFISLIETHVGGLG